MTQDEQVEFEKYDAKSLEVGLTTGPTNRVEAEAALRDLYHFCGKQEPKFVFFVRSPNEAQKLINVFLKLDIDDEKDVVPLVEMGMSNDDIVGHFVSMYDGDGKFFVSHSYSYGSNESYWIYQTDFLVNETNVKLDEKQKEGLEVMRRLAINSGWHYVFDGCGIICDRPEKIVVQDKMLHNESGPAVEYSDGWKCWAIENVIVDEQIVMSPETLTSEQIKAELNAEAARIMVQRYGVAKYLMETGAKIIDTDPGLGLDGSAMRGLVEDNTGRRWLIGSDGSTGREYHMPVPDEAETCAQAHEMISGLNESDCLAEA